MVDAARGFDQLDLQFVEQILTGTRSAPTLVEQVAEQAAAEDVAKGGHDIFGVAEVVNPRAVQAGMAVAVVPLALGLVGEDFVGFGGFLELLLGLGVAGVFVRMELQGELPVRLLDLFLGGVALDPEDFIIVTFRGGHRHGVSKGVAVEGVAWAFP